MPPADKEMIRHFATHEAAFDKIHRIMAESSKGSFHYPPLSPCDVFILDSTEQIFYQSNRVQNTPVHGLSGSGRIQLGSLLSEIGCGLVLVDRREQEAADSVYVSLFMLCYSRGVVDTGTSGSFIYDLELKSYCDTRITERGDLNKIYRRTYNDTMLYKPIKEGWYIRLDHSRQFPFFASRFYEIVTGSSYFRGRMLYLQMKELFNSIAI